MQKINRGKRSFWESVLHLDTEHFNQFSPLRLFTIIIFSIFIAEIIAMIVVSYLDSFAYALVTLVDAGIMVILIFPILYWLSFRPLLQQIGKFQSAEKSLQLLSSVVQQTADTVVVTNCDGVIEYVNPAFEERTGYTKEEALGQTPRVLKSGVHTSGFYEQLWGTVLRGQVFHGEITNRKKDGDIFHEVKTITPLRNQDGMITHFVATGKDITERKEAEEKLRKAYDDLEIRVQDRTEELRIANSELEDEIHVRRQAEEALQQSEQRLNRAQEIAHLGSWELDLLTNQLTWSDEAYRIFGLQPQEFGATYEAFLDAVHPDDRAAVNEAYTGSIREGKDAYEIEHRVVKHSSGEIRIVHEKCEHFRDESGKIIRSIGMVHDITERQRAEEQLHYQATLLSNVNDAIVASNAEYHLTAWNSAAESLYGWTAEEVIGRNGLEIMHTIWPETDAAEMRRTIAETGRWRGEATQQRKDGSRFPVEVSSIVLHDAYGRITGYVSVNRDITGRKQAEQALQKSEAMLRAVLENMPSGVTVRDAVSGELIVSNTRSREILGTLVDTVDHLSEYQGLHPDGSFYQNDEWPLFRSIATGEQIDLEEIELQRNSGLNKFISISSAPIHNAAGQIVSAVSVFQDITERKKAEMDLQQLNRTLRALSASNQTMLRASNETELLDEVCKIIVEDCGHAMVWIGYAEDDEEKSVRPVASAGFEEGYLETLKITWAETERGYGPTGMTIRTGKPHGCRNMLTDPQFAPWREQALKRGYASSMVLPLTAEGKTFGAMTIYSRQPDSFSTNEETLLAELARDLSHGIETIRLREANEVAEAELRRAHDELELRVQERTEQLAAANLELSSEIMERKEVERQLRIQTAAMDAAANGIIITDPNGNILWTNPAVTQMSGYTEDDLIGQSTRLFSSGRQDADFYRDLWGTIRAGNVWHGETVNRRKDGVDYIEEQTITPVRDENGQISHFIAVKQDITERKLIYAQLEDSNRDLQTLSASERQQRFLAEGLIESSMALNMSLELHAVLDHIFEQTRRTIPYLMADVVLIDEGVANVVRQWGKVADVDAKDISENNTLKLQDFPIWERICATQSPVIVADAVLEDQWKKYLGLPWIQSYLGAPLIYNDQVIGIIDLVSDQANAFHEGMAKTLRAFAAPAAVAIQNARLYENEQQNRKVAEILSAATVALAQTLDIQMVMETILDYVQFVTPLDIAFVILSEGEELYKIRAVRARDDDRARQDSLQDQTIDIFSEPIIRSYFAKYESTFIPDAREVANWNPPLELSALNCWLGIPLESMGKILGIVVVACTEPYSLTRNQIQLAEAVVKQAVVALQNAWLFEQVRSGRERLQQLSRHLVEIQENERKYIARELHDETSQSLTSLKLGLQVIEQNAAGHEQLMGQVKNLKALADETLESLHHLAVNLRPASLDHLGLVDALTSLIQLTRDRNGVTAHFKTIGSMQDAALTEEMETSIYRIVQESITNVIRHAHATYVDVILEWQDGKIIIIIEDDGVGMDLEKARESGRLGLIGMQERAEMLGGKLLVESTPQVGTTLVVEIPYVNSNTYRR